MKRKTRCCKRFNPRPWDRKTIKWKNKLFLKDKIGCFFNLPLGLGAVMKRDMEMIQKAKALTRTQIMLYDCIGLFGADIYIHVSKPVPGMKTARISGTFISKVFEGPCSQTGKWVREMQEYVKSRKKKIKKLYFFYTTCPGCAKSYGKNYVVLLAKI